MVLGKKVDNFRKIPITSAMILKNLMKICEEFYLKTPNIILLHKNAI